MAYYSRSDTDMDAVSQFFPQSFLGRGRPRTLRGRMKLSGLGFWDTLFPSDVSAVPTYGTYDTAPAATGFDWGKLFSTVGDIYAAKTQAELTEDLYRLNLTRAQQGLAPIPASAVAPQVQVGVAPDVQRTILMVALGGAAILGGAYVFGGLGKGRRRARRR